MRGIYSLSSFADNTHNRTSGKHRAEMVCSGAFLAEGKVRNYPSYVCTGTVCTGTVCTASVHCVLYTYT